MVENNEIVLDIKINTEEVASKLAAATKALAEHKQQQKELKKAMEESNGTNAVAAKIYADVSAQIEKESRDIKSSTALLQAETMARIDDNSSLDEQRQALNAAQKAYAQLSGEEKKAADSSGGLREQIARLSDRVKEQEAAIGDTRRTVGNYAMQTAEAAGKMGFFGQGVTSVITPVRNLTMGLKAASATPFLAIISALITLLTSLGSKFKGNAAAMEKLNEVMGVFSGIGNIVNIIIDKIAKGIGWVAEKALELADKLGLLSKSMKEGQEIAKEDLAIQKAQQDVALKNAEDTKKIAELKAEVNNKDKHSVKERMDMLKQANDLEEGIAKRKYDLAKREYELQKKKNEQSESSQEDLKKENDLKIAMINAETELFNKQKELNEKMSSLRQEESAKAKAADEARIKEVEETAERLAEIRDEMRRRNQTDLENELEDLRAKRDKELEIEGLTEEEKQQIRDYYRNLEKQKTADAEAAKIQARKDARAQFGLDTEKTQEEQELELLQAAREKDLLNDEEYEQAKTLITQKYSKLRAEDIQAEVSKATELYQNQMKTATGSAAAAMNALGNLVGAFANESKEAADAQKAFAIGSILINQAMSIAEGAKGISAAMAGAAAAAAATGPAAPIMLGVYQAQMVGQVLAVVASVANSIVQAKQVFDQAEKHSTGGMVGGNSYTGDKVLARLNSGEGVLTAKGVENATDLVAGLDNGSLGFNYELMAQAISALPAPIMAYEEFKRFEQDVTTYNELASV